jgi:hypothetical protein
MQPQTGVMHMWSLVLCHMAGDGRHDWFPMCPRKPAGVPEILVPCLASC